jgi:hypothetical protein
VHADQATPIASSSCGDNVVEFPKKEKKSPNDDFSARINNVIAMAGKVWNVMFMYGLRDYTIDVLGKSLSDIKRILKNHFGIASDIRISHLSKEVTDVDMLKSMYSARIHPVLSPASSGGRAHSRRKRRGSRKSRSRRARKSRRH